MKLAEDENSIAQNKLLILYIFNKLNRAVNANELLRLVLSITDMNYFYFQQFLLDLITTKYIIQYNYNENLLYEITDEGKKVLELTENIIPGLIKQRIDDKFKENISAINDELAVVAEVVPEGKDDFFVTCKLVEHEKKLMNITLFVSSIDQANKIITNWKENASRLYPEIFKLFAEDKFAEDKFTEEK